MTFKKDFPSLEWKWEFIDGGENKISAVRTKDIQEHCLDKSVVAKKLSEFISTPNIGIDFDVVVQAFLKLKKELKLDK